MALYSAKSHFVQIHQITAVRPLTDRTGKVLSPDEALTLILDNGARVNWFADKASSGLGLQLQSPVEGDYLVTDVIFNAQYPITPAQLLSHFKISKKENKQ